MPKKKQTARQRAIANGYRSGLEEATAERYANLGISVEYEKYCVSYEVPARTARYTPDFVQPNGIVIETKGRFQTKDRQKHILIKKQFQDLDLRFVFSNPNDRISKQSNTTYADWCEENGFLYAKGTVPGEWIEEPLNERSIEALHQAGVKQ